MPLQITGNEGTIITQATAKTEGANYVNSSRFSANSNIKAHLVGKNKINDLLNQSGCLALRIYYITKISGGISTPDLVVVGVDKDGNDILANAKVLNSMLPCPSHCADPGKGVMD